MKKSKNPYWISYMMADYTAKNRYQKAVLELVKKYDRQMMTNPFAWITQLGKDIEETRAEYPRCGQLDIRQSRSKDWEDGNDVMVLIGDLVIFKLLKVHDAFAGELATTPIDTTE